MSKISILLINTTTTSINKTLFYLNKQTLKDLEFIFLIEIYKKEIIKLINKNQNNDKRIKLITFKEENFATQLNKGLSVAQGEYVAFILGNNFPDLDLYFRLYSKGFQKKSDIVIGNLFFYYTKPINCVIKTNFIDKNKVKKINKSLKHRKKNIVLAEYCSNHILLWSSIYKKQYLIEHNIFFEKDYNIPLFISFYFKTIIQTYNISFCKNANLYYCLDKNSINFSNELYFNNLKSEFENSKSYIRNNISLKNTSFYLSLLLATFYNILIKNGLYVDQNITENKCKYISNYLYNDFSKNDAQCFMHLVDFNNFKNLINNPSKFNNCGSIKISNIKNFCWELKYAGFTFAVKKLCIYIKKRFI